MTFSQKIVNYNKAGYPYLYIQTHEETRVQADIIASYKESNETDKDKYELFIWEPITGMVKLNISSTNKPEHLNNLDKNDELLKFIESEQSKKQIYILKDFHKAKEAFKVVRHLRNLFNNLEQRQSTVIFVSPILNIPEELKKDITTVDYALPDDEGIGKVLDYISQSVKKEVEPKIKQDAVEAAKGLTYQELKNVFSFSVKCAKKFDDVFVKEVFEQKIQSLKQSNGLTYIPSDVGFKDFGGAEGLKKWLKIRQHAFSKEAKEFGLSAPKGIFLAGIQGCGKTLMAKVIANEFKVPLWQWDIGAMFSGLVGSSEANFRNTIKIIESIGKCVVLIDEVEKSLGKQAVMGHDSGASSRSFATLLSWLNDRKSQVFIVATSNDFTKLPPELTRKGRFDELFWSDLPSDNDRKQIIEVVLRKYKQKIENFDLEKLVKFTKDFTGAEIDNVIMDSMYTAFFNKKQLSDDIIFDHAHEFPIVAKIYEADINDMRKKAEKCLKNVKLLSEDKSIEQSFDKLRAFELD